MVEFGTIRTGVAQTTTQWWAVRGRMGQGPIPRVCGVLYQSCP